MSKILETSCNNKHIGKFDIKSDIRQFHQTVFMAMIDTPDIR